jgi:hypothetical protein
MINLETMEHKHVQQLDIFIETSEQYQKGKEAIRSRFEEYRQ